MKYIPRKAFEASVFDYGWGDRVGWLLIVPKPEGLARLRQLCSFLAITDYSRMEMFERRGHLFVMAHYKPYEATRAASNHRFLSDALSRWGADHRFHVLDMATLRWYCLHDRKQFDSLPFHRFR